MVFERPQHRPQDSGWSQGPRHSQGEYDPWAGSPYQAYPPQTAYNPPKGVYKPPLPPKYQQLDLFEFHGINSYEFRTPLKFEAIAGGSSYPFAQQEQQRNHEWQRSKERRQQEKQEREERYKYNQLDWLDPEYQLGVERETIPLREGESPSKTPVSDERLNRQPDPKQFRLPDLSGLREIRDYLLAHPEEQLTRGANLDDWLAKVAASKVKSAPSDGVKVAASELTPGMLATPAGKVSEGAQTSQPESLLRSGAGAVDTTAFTVPLGAIAAPMVVAQTIPFPNGGLSLPPLPQIPSGVLRGAGSLLKGVGKAGGFLVGPVLEGLLADPAGPDESKFIRHPSAPTAVPTAPPPVPVSTPVPTAPMSVEPMPQAMPHMPEQRSKEQQQFEQQQRQWEKEQQQREAEFKAQQAAFKVQQVAQKQLWAKQEKLNDLSVGLMLNEGHVKDFEAQLTPQQKGSLTREVKERYKALTGLAQQADNPFKPYEVAEIQQKIRQQVLYERYVPIREIYHFGNQFLNGYSPQKMQAVRGYFDQVFEGGYSKSIPEGKQRAIMQAADVRYTQETGKKPNHNDVLWKTLRNVEASQKFPDLWTQFKADLSKAQDNNVKKTIVHDNDPNLGSNALNRPGQRRSLIDPLKPETFPTGGEILPSLGGFDNTVKPELTKPETFPTNEKVDGVTHVFEYTTDYRKNYEQFYGPIPAGSQIHHLAPRAVFNKSSLTQEWVKRGLTKLDYPENLEALPQTKDAYDKSSIKIQHSGSHGKWSEHATEVLRDAQEDLKDQYGSLDKVPNDVMKQTKDDVLQQLREDLLDKDLGIEEGWVKPAKKGMDKLSQSQNFEQIG